MKGQVAKLLLLGLTVCLGDAVCAGGASAFRMLARYYPPPLDYYAPPPPGTYVPYPAYPARPPCAAVTPGLSVVPDEARRVAR